jgi:SAM-dependent methyltransferase
VHNSGGRTHVSHRQSENEASFRRLERIGEAVDYAGRSFEQFDLRPFLEGALGRMTFAAEHPRAFEYGTGTGPGACFLARRGFVVDAIDISPTAIALARRFAAERGLTISFVVGDITRLTPTGAPYDLVVDNYCLQHLVGDDERRRALTTVRRLLAPGGYFVVGTVLRRADRDFGDDRFDPSTGIVYRRVEGDPGPDAVRLGSEWWFAWRRIVLSPDALDEELRRSGLHVIHQDGARCLCVAAD